MEHLNFCRHLIKQYSPLVDVPSLDATWRARMHHAMDLASASQKFMLPDGGLLIDDPELRAIDSDMPLRLPHSFVALEFLHADDVHRQDVLTKRIVFAREREEFIHLSGAGCETHDGIWVWLPECAIPMRGYLNKSDNSGSISVNYRPLAPNEAPADLYALVLKVFMCFMNAISCANVHVARSDPKHAGKKVKSALPFDTYHVLTIDVPGRTHEQSGPSGSHRSPREHLRRGHIRRLDSGKRVWVNATVVAAGRNAGVVKKDYALRMAA